ncbi:MAG: carboxypeptidase regulatory-like domain-containing protein [Infirmifilum sp.]|uniref:Alpha-galactosidase NEW3 domain-containing protein n=1 Tax=Infirmifilum uzonense TaxID=1550241 RepID=A0A0F7FG62_9CREN|nr:carboxypeptidase regulatory-like domain-containing protein [Infirmifilum uzonense]AKG38114.1 hypothetical protein MA03_00755 [Infirmifilum uzonense]
MRIKSLGGLLVIVVMLVVIPPSYSQTLYFYGRVTDLQLNPIAGAQVSVYSNNLLVTSTLTDKDGTFNLRLPPGTYVLRAYLKGYAPREIMLVATQEKAGSLGTITLEQAISVYTETTQLTVLQGDILNLTIKLENKGLDPLTVNFKIEAPTSWVGYLTLPGGLRVDNIMIEPGREKTVFLNLQVPMDAFGKNFVRVRLSWENLTATIDYVFEVQPKKWNLIELPASSIKAYPGAQLKIPFTLRNPFTLDAEMALTVEPPQGWVASIVDANSITVSGLTLAPKATRQLFLILYIPPSAKLGLYAVSIYTDVSGSRFITKLDVSVESRYDLLNLTVGVSRLNITGGSSTVIPLIIRNDGNMATVTVLKASSNNEGIRPILTVSGQAASTLYLLPGESRQVNLLVNASSQTAPGLYELIVQANGTTSYTAKKILVNVVGSYSFRILNQDFLIITVPGGTVTYKVNVVNSGTYPLQSLNLYTSFNPEKLQVTVQPERLSLLPGETGSFSLQINVPPDVREGVYNIVFTVESGSIRDTRVLLVWVRPEASFSFTLIMAVLVAVSFFLVYYGRRKYA